MQFLAEKVRTREVNHRIKWREFVEIAKENESYVNMVGQTGTTPREMFEVEMNKEKDILKKNKSWFKSLIKVSIKYQ